MWSGEMGGSANLPPPEHFAQETGFAWKLHKLCRVKHKLAILGYKLYEEMGSG